LAWNRLIFLQQRQPCTWLELRRLFLLTLLHGSLMDLTVHQRLVDRNAPEFLLWFLRFSVVLLLRQLHLDSHVQLHHHHHHQSLHNH
jgi:hypothetical protein